LIKYWLIAIVLKIFVDFLLLMWTNRLCTYPVQWLRCLMGSCIGGLYAGLCLLPGMSGAGRFLWRLVSLVISATIAFGLTGNGLQRCCMYLLVSIFFSGITVCLDKKEWSGVLLFAGSIVLLYVVCRDGRTGGGDCVPVEIEYAGKRVSFTALKYTGNTLRDPLTGASVLVVGADIAQTLTGLTPKQLNDPYETILEKSISGLRIIPYTTIGNRGLLLAVRIANVRIGKWSGSTVVAFAPVSLPGKNNYQALTGGVG